MKHPSAIALLHSLLKGTIALILDSFKINVSSTVKKAKKLAIYGFTQQEKFIRPIMF